MVEKRYPFRRRARDLVDGRAAVLPSANVMGKWFAGSLLVSFALLASGCESDGGRVGSRCSESSDCAPSLECLQFQCRQGPQSNGGLGYARAPDPVLDMGPRDMGPRDMGPRDTGPPPADMGPPPADMGPPDTGLDMGGDSG